MRVGNTITSEFTPLAVVARPDISARAATTVLVLSICLSAVCLPWIMPRHIGKHQTRKLYSARDGPPGRSASSRT